MIGGGRARAGATPRSGFSLIEVLMSIFILGIGVISIAALFPAGIAQQQRSADDVMGPIAANNALAILRSRLAPEDFGTFEQFGTIAPRPTVPGDWTWLRPSLLFSDDPDDRHRGANDIFSWFANRLNGPATEFPGGYRDSLGNSSVPPLLGIPFERTPANAFGQPPKVIITQRERYFPMRSHEVPPDGPAPSPQLVWDCMFRRFQGRIQVAIFVYRVTVPGGESTRGFTVARSIGQVPPLPVWVDLDVTGTAWDAYGMDGRENTGDDAIVAVLSGCDDYDPFEQDQSWQEAGQWIVDQDNAVHRVLSTSCNEINDEREVELLRPVSIDLGSSSHYRLPPRNGIDNVVSDIWYIPAVDALGRKLTPVYVLVEDL